VEEIIHTNPHHHHNTHIYKQVGQIKRSQKRKLGIKEVRIMT
jgi:hypothetical protein